ncbi:MAG: alpha-amylase family glycosyl hydrolase [Bacteroidota bacterium]
MFSNIEFNFHISRKARDKYKIDDSLFTLRGNVVIGDIRTAREVAAKINADQRTIPVSPSELLALGILHEVFHYIFKTYRTTYNPNVFLKCDKNLEEKYSTDEINNFLATFVDIFPPPAVYHHREIPRQYLAGLTEGTPHRHLALEEMLLVWIENQNPALVSFDELIGDQDLKKNKEYPGVTQLIDKFFDNQPPFGTEKESLLKMLLKPIQFSPASIMDQLEYIRIHWEKYLAGSPIFRQLLLATDFIREEGKYFAMKAAAEADKKRIPQVTQTPFFGWGDKDSPPVPQFYGSLYENEMERFSQDLNWMPHLVLIAKTAFVWLDQLSKQYRRPITRLDEIPDEELDLLARRGFTGLWLIGIWERSYASKRIKHIHGNIDAAASAYSLNDYVVAADLGGEEAFWNLQHRAMRRGIRLASDMVPNHMGIDSRWMIQHPNWFLASPYLPFPNYRFDGPDLSSDERVGIFIEDGYWHKTDAAVVFKRIDRWTGDVRYIYHGNDGTSTPWNDTAQLNFLNAEVREAVIQTILHVARMFPIVRFDAAMVLAKRHIQRLWFPMPGHGGAIPSRSEFAMTKEQFDAVIPHEFWREVVDRVQQEVPDTLLLAEAFWMMEGYFVRSLGMHRVYNSAFMNMLKKEENLNFRLTIKNVLEYNPQILKRHVNFMNNPDEETAVAQFGKDDKYFGVCVLLCTMPGLPMFGHGQIEGYSEKYGMEYRRAYNDEQPDGRLILRHEREIFPLLKKRYLFGEVENFFLYDCYSENGLVNEDVFAFSNRQNDERALVIYNNRYAHATGWINMSAGFLAGGDIVQLTLAEGLNLIYKPGTYCIFRDTISGLEYIHPNKALIEQGLFIDLGAFKYHVFLDFREVESSIDKPYDVLAGMLAGRGVLSIDEELIDLRYQSIHKAFTELVAPEQLRAYREILKPSGDSPGVCKILQEKIEPLAAAIEIVEGVNPERDAAMKSLLEEFSSISRLPQLFLTHQDENEKWQPLVSKFFTDNGNDEARGWRVLFLWTICRRLHTFLGKMNDHARDLLHEWRLTKIINHSIAHLETGEMLSARETDLVHILSMREIDDTLSSESPLSAVVLAAMKVNLAQNFTGMNVYNDAVYFNKEKMEEFLYWLFIMRILYVIPGIKSTEVDSYLSKLYNEIKKILAAAEKAGYGSDRFTALIANPVPNRSKNSNKAHKNTL